MSDNKTLVYRIYNKKTNEWGQAGAFKFTPKIKLAKTWTRQTLSGHLALYGAQNCVIPKDLEVIEYALEEISRVSAKEYKTSR